MANSHHAEPDDGIVAVSGSGSDNAGAAEIVLFTIGLDLAVRSRQVLGRGVAPSIAASDAWIVVGWFEELTPVAAAPGTEEQVGPLHLGFHVVVLDRPTRAIAGARIFRGERLLLPGGSVAWTTHALAVRDGRVYVSLPGPADATLVSARLPALSTIRTLRLGDFGWPQSAPVYSVGRYLVVPTPQGWRVLSPDLVVLDAAASPGRSPGSTSPATSSCGLGIDR